MVIKFRLIQHTLNLQSLTQSPIGPFTTVLAVILLNYVILAEMFSIVNGKLVESIEERVEHGLLNLQAHSLIWELHPHLCQWTGIRVSLLEC